MIQVDDVNIATLITNAKSEYIQQTMSRLHTAAEAALASIRPDNYFTISVEKGRCNSQRAHISILVIVWRDADPR